jgi:hypothetical protein
MGFNGLSIRIVYKGFVICLVRNSFQDFKIMKTRILSLDFISVIANISLTGFIIYLVDICHVVFNITKNLHITSGFHMAKDLHMFTDSHILIGLQT